MRGRTARQVPTEGPSNRPSNRRAIRGARGLAVQSGSLPAMATPDVAIRQVPATRHRAEISAVRELLRAAFADDGEGFTAEDWEHTMGGTHFLLEEAWRSGLLRLGRAA